jgi:hypothetical protein
VSDNWLVIVPRDPYGAPDPAALEAARTVVERELPEADDVRVESSPAPEFIDAGANFQSVACPACGARLDDWWPRAMDRDFADLSAVTPCCGTATSLNDLVYVWPQAFARASLHVLNPNVSELPATVKDAVERTLGRPTRVVWRHL